MTAEGIYYHIFCIYEKSNGTDYIPTNYQGMTLLLTSYDFIQHSSLIFNYRVFRAQADWAFISPTELPVKELRHLPRKMLPRGTTY
jgi:hypothetical protein